ncbi:MAG: M23 family metallopeptidase [Oscillospiraceae bacterium]|nr:M23 family metallopeptidase [Oscillospiraceae bacterium]
MINGKKLFRTVILVILLFIPTYLAVYNILLIYSDKFTVENTTKIEIIGANDQILAEYTDKKDINIHIKTLENSKKVGSSSRKFEYEQPLIIKFYKGEKQFVYAMYLSLNTNDCLIMTSERELLLMDENDAKRILNTPLSDSIYKNNKIPSCVLYEGDPGAVEIYPSGGEWMIKKADGNFYPSTIPNEVKTSNSARAYQNKDFDVTFSAEPDLLHIDVQDSKEIIFSDVYSNFIANFSCEELREFQYILSAEWYKSDTADYYGKATYVMDVKYYVTAKFDISSTEADPGDIVAITAYNMSDDENLILSTDIGYETKFMSVGAHKIALIPISSDFVGRTFHLKLTSDLNDPKEYFLKINEKSEQSFNMAAQDQSVEAHLETGPQSQKQSKYNEIFTNSAEEGRKHWSEKFAMPKEGRILLDYGWKVTTNTGHPYINKGINIEMTKGEPVRASNAGKVIFAEEIPEDGKLVVIDHGMGIKTWYGHLDQIDVQAGDGVAKGQQLGSAGTSGLYTTIGSNLYFAVSVKNIFVNPLPVISDGVPGIDSANFDPPAGESGEDIPEPIDADLTGETENE